MFAKEFSERGIRRPNSKTFRGLVFAAIGLTIGGLVLLQGGDALLHGTTHEISALSISLEVLLCGTFILLGFILMVQGTPETDEAGRIFAEEMRSWQPVEKPGRSSSA